MFQSWRCEDKDPYPQGPTNTVVVDYIYLERALVIK